MEFSALEKHREALREVKMRQRVYDAWVADGRMSQSEASRRIAIMSEIASEYEKASEKERLL